MRITYVNKINDGILEEAFAKLFARKTKSGLLNPVKLKKMREGSLTNESGHLYKKV